MKRWTTAMGISAALLLTEGCRKDPPVSGYVPGEILVGLLEDVSFEDTYKLVADLHLHLGAAYGFVYQVDTSLVTLDSVMAVFGTKAYLTRHGQTFGIHHADPGVYVSTSFFDLDSNDNVDWNSTVEQLGLVEVPHLVHGLKWGTLVVPIGQEYFWVNDLPKYDIIEHAQLNHYL